MLQKYPMRAYIPAFKDSEGNIMALVQVTA